MRFGPHYISYMCVVLLRLRLVSVLIVFEWQAKRKKFFSRASNFTIDAPYIPYTVHCTSLSYLCVLVCQVLEYLEDMIKTG